MIPIQQALLSRLPEYIDLSKITTVAIPLCFGDPKDPDDGCHDRFCAAIRGFSAIFSNTLIIQTGGTDADPLCDKMYKAVKDGRKYLWARRFMAIPLGWGTRSEIANAFSIIRILSIDQLKNGINTRDPDFRIIIASNKAHLRRIKWYVKIHNISNFNVVYREAEHEFGFISTLREWIGTPLIMFKDWILGFQKVHGDMVLKMFNKF